MDIALTIYTFLLNIIQVFTLYMIVKRLTPIKHDSVYKCLIFISLSSIVVQGIRAFPVSQAIGTVICVTASFLLMMVFYGWKRSNIYAFIIYTVLSILSELTVALIMLIPSTDARALILGNTIFTAAAALTSRVIQVFLTRMALGVIKKDRSADVPFSGFVLFGMIIVFIMLLCIVLVFMLALANDPVPDWFLLFYLVCTVSFIAVSVITQRIAVQNIREREERKMIDLQSELSLEVHHSLEQLKQYEHDYRKHLQTILSLTHEGMYTEAEKYYNELTDEFDSAHMSMIENLPALSATIQRFKSLSQKKGIDFAAVLPPALETQVSEMHLCVILSNLLENAAEACEKLDDERRITVSLRRDQPKGNLHIDVVNTYAPDKSALRYINGLPSTTKEDRDLHGFGLRSVKRIVRTYNGTLKVSADEGNRLFSVSIEF